MKSLREIFEFFPNAKYITGNRTTYGDGTVIEETLLHTQCKPNICSSGDWVGNSFESVQLGTCAGSIDVDWGNLKTTRSRFVSREEIINEGEYTEEEKAEGWGTCTYCSEEEDECGCNTDDTERFHR